MKKSIYELNFDRLEKLGVVVQGTAIQYGRSVSDGFMDLVVESWSEGQGMVIVSLAHYFECNGDLCQDPDMTLKVCTRLRTVEALTFQQAMPPLYQEVYPEPGRYYPALKKQLNAFLSQWLRNLIAQGHGKQWSILSLADSVSLIEQNG